MIINERLWARINQEIMDLMKESGPLIMYQLGLSYGYEVRQQGLNIIRDHATAIKFLEIHGLLAGWGRFVTSDFHPTNGKIDEPVTVKVYGSFFAMANKEKLHDPNCFFVSGLLAGIIDGLLEDSHNCVECRCMSCGSPYCEFNIARV